MATATITEPGAYGIVAIDPTIPNAIVCGSCGRAWAEDITPAGRCPWEDLHAEEDDSDESMPLLISIPSAGLRVGALSTAELYAQLTDLIETGYVLEDILITRWER